MATATPIYTLRYPEPIDSVDVPRDIGWLAADVEAALGGFTVAGAYLARPAAGTVKPGTVFFATDTLGSWRSDGAAWTLVGQGEPQVTPAQMAAAPFTTP